MGAVLGWDYEHKIKWIPEIVTISAVTPIDMHAYTTKAVTAQVTLPATAPIGFKFSVSSNNNVPWGIATNSGQILLYKGKEVPGLTGFNSVSVTCVIANKKFIVSDYNSVIKHRFPGTMYGTRAGGFKFGTGTSTIEKISFITDIVSVIPYTLKVARWKHSSQSSSTYGYVSGGEDMSNQVTSFIEKYSFALNTNGVVISNMYTGTRLSAGLSSATYGYSSGGDSNPVYTLRIEKFSFSSDLPATLVGNSVNIARDITCGVSSENYGYTIGGESYSAFNITESINFNTDSNATDLGIGISTISNNAGCSSLTHGYSLGGDSATTPTLTIIYKFSFETQTYVTILSVISPISANTGTSEIDHGYSIAGLTNITTPVFTNSIDKLTYSNDVVSLGITNLSENTYYSTDHQF